MQYSINIRIEAGYLVFIVRKKRKAGRSDERDRYFKAGDP
jgi:hypothetical protein